MFDPLTGTTIALVSTLIRQAIIEFVHGPGTIFELEGLFFFISFHYQTRLKHLNSNYNDKTVPYTRIYRTWDRQIDIRKKLLATILLERVREIS